MAMIIWLLNLQLPMQSVATTTKVGSSNLAHRDVLDTTFSDKVFPLTCGRSMVFSGYLGFLYQ